MVLLAQIPNYRSSESAWLTVLLLNSEKDTYIVISAPAPSTRCYCVCACSRHSAMPSIFQLSLLASKAAHIHYVLHVYGWFSGCRAGLLCGLFWRAVIACLLV